MEVAVIDWKELMKQAVQLMLNETIDSLSGDHLDDTPQRVVRMYQECLMGPPLDHARIVLKRGFQLTMLSEMIHVRQIEFVSWCAHHLVPILAVGHFAYIPNKRIVGLSKIVRLVEIVAQRPQVQETLTDDVVRIFDEEVRPDGCGFVVDASHLCMIARGVRKVNSQVRTSALRGTFFNPSVKNEFFAGLAGRS